MPCRDDGPPDGYYEGKEQAERQLVPMLCSACTALERIGYNFSENPQLDRWWHEHKKKDEREKLQAAREAVEKKLAIEWANTLPVSHLTNEQRAIMKKHGVL